jgi:rRNA small subunit pseudouridine methyltransferase Nep1
MKGIRNEIKRGRPDLVHFSLLEACSIPFYFENKLNVFVHTIVDDKVISVGQNVRLPKSYHRFIGLVEKLYVTKKIEENNSILLEIKQMNFGELIKKKLIQNKQLHFLVKVSKALIKMLHQR